MSSTNKAVGGEKRCHKEARGMGSEAAVGLVNLGFVYRSRKISLAIVE